MPAVLGFGGARAGPGRRGQQGWVVALVCLTLMAGSALLATVLQQTLSEQERAATARWQALQAQAAAEGLLARTLALLDESGSVDDRCLVVNNPGGGARPLAPRLMVAGAQITCSIGLLGEIGPQAWSCQCPGSTPAGAAMPPPAPTDPDTAVATLRIESTGSGALRAVVQAWVVRSTGSHAVTGPSWQFSVLLKQDGTGVWREVIGSWNDLS